MKTKRILLSLLALLASIGVYAEFTVDNIIYEITSTTNNTVKVRNGYYRVEWADDDGNFTIPAGYVYETDWHDNGEDWDLYAYYYYSQFSNSSSISIPSSVTYNGTTYQVTGIGDYAFSNCLSLTSVTLPNSITTIGKSAFNNCSIRSVNVRYADYSKISTNSILPSYLPSSATWKYYINNSLITSLNIPNSVTSIGNNAFYHAKDIVSVSIPNSVTSIGSSAFSGCSGITTLTLPSSLTSIGGSAFSGCSGITTLTLPSSLTSIGSSAFEGCSNLAVIDINATNLTSIGASAFSGCSKLKTVNLNSIASWLNCSLASASSSPFCNGADLYVADEEKTTISFPVATTSIPSYSYYGCRNITSVTIPAQVTTIGTQAFGNCPSLTAINVNSNNSNFSSEDGILYNANKTTLLSCIGGKTGAVTVPQTVTSISASAFYNCTGITSISLPSSLTSIGSQAFYGCSGTLTVNCNIPDSSSSPFTGSSFSSVTFGDGVTSIGNSAFSGCSGITSLTLPSSLTSIGSSAFYGCTGITSLTLPSSLTSIGNTAFQNCRGITSLTLPSSLTSIGISTFYNCSGLTSVAIPESVTSIGNCAFKGCSALTSVTIPNSVTSIGEEAFSGCSNVTSVSIPQSVTTIGNSAFSSCSGTLVVNCDIPSGSTTHLYVDNTVNYITIYLYPFKDSSFSNVIMGDNVKSIGRYAFYNCSSLTSIKVDKESPLSINSNTFSNRTNAILYVPTGSKAAYEAADYWKEFKEIIEFIEGDVNGDGETDVLDVVDIARFVVGTPAETFVSILADMNSDGQVNIGDAVTLVNEIAGDQNFVKPMMAPRKITADEESLSLTEGNSGLSLALENQRSYTAFQFDLYVPECADVTKMMLNAQRKQKHQLLYNKVENGHWRVTAFSTSNRSFQGNDGELLSFALDTEGDIALRNIQFFDAEGNGYQFDDICQSGVTGVETIHNSQFTIHNSDIYDIQGRRHTKLQRGLNIVNGKKVFVK